MKKDNMNTLSKIKEEESEDKREMMLHQEEEEEEEEKDLNKLKLLNNKKLFNKHQLKQLLDKDFILNDVYSIH